MGAPRAPRGYIQGDYPLQHEIIWNFGLTADTTPASGGNCTQLPLFFHDEAAEDPTAINVNIRHTSFDTSSQMNCVSNSIIPRTNFGFSAVMSEDMIEVSKTRAIRFKWFPFYLSFQDYMAEDDRTGFTLKEILELVVDDTNEEIAPLYDDTKLLNAWTMPTNQAGLTTTQVMENVGWDSSLFYDALKFYGNGRKISSVIGPIRNVTVTRDRPYYYHSNNFTNPRVKRMNSYSYCAVMFYLPKENTHEQILEAAVCTDNKSSLFFRGLTSFPEWNKSWLQDEN